MISMQRQNAPAQQTALMELEQKLGHPLPNDYRSYLEMVNGGRPEEYEFQVKGWGSIPLMSLFGAGVGGRADLAFQYMRMKHLLPEGFLPIGNDPGGNFLCLKAFGSQAGAVYLWDHAYLRDEEADEAALHLVANSFNAFLSALTSSS